MEKLLASLTNLGYEFFGIFLPGLGVWVAVVAIWYSAGDALDVITDGVVPTLHLGAVLDHVDRLTSTAGACVFVFFVAIAYFFGHMLKWLSRSGPPMPETATTWQRFWRTLRLRPYKSKENFHSENLGIWYSRLAKKYAGDVGPIKWTAFYPIARMRIVYHSKPSLIATFQNKYTLHRSLSVLSSLVFWLTMVVAILSVFFVAAQPRWPLLALLVAASLSAVYGFGSSYEYAWKLWGDALISEAYAIEFLEKNEEHGDPGGVREDD